ncbi:MAG: NAD-dependent epimerase/dehydratase family protein [Dokdonella sp.]
MRRALVIGASGQIGQSLIPHLLERGDYVFALSRRDRTSRSANLEWIRGELFAAMPGIPEVDVIFSLGPLNGFAQWLANARSIGSPRVVAIGSMSAESKHESNDPAERELAQTLRRAEKQLAEAAEAKGIIWTLLRPTMIYGGGRDRNLTPLARFGARTHLFPKLFGATGLRQPVHVDDLALACLAAAALDAASRRSFDLGGGERLEFSMMLDRVRASLGTLVIPLPIPLVAARAVWAIALLNHRWRGVGLGAISRLRADLVANDDAARSLLNWSPRGFRPEAATWRMRSDRI